jgi:hypothetical protein
MAINPTLLADSIHPLLKSTPIGQSPVTTVTTVSNTDGTSTTTTSGTLQNVYMPDPLARVIADAVAKAVVAHLQTEAVVVGTCPTGTAGGPLIAGKIT